jgi:hypothetical protein
LTSSIDEHLYFIETDWPSNADECEESQVVEESKQGGATEIELTIITPGTLLFL